MINQRVVRQIEVKNFTEGLVAPQPYLILNLLHHSTVKRPPRIPECGMLQNQDEADYLQKYQKA